MNTQPNHQPSPDDTGGTDATLKPVLEAFDRAPVPPRPDTADTLRWLDAQNERLTPNDRFAAEAERGDAGEGSSSHSLPRKRFTMRMLSPLAAAASLALVVAGVLLFSPSGFDSNAVFAQAVQQMRAAQTLAFTMSMSVPGHDAPAEIKATVKNPGSMRTETTMTANGQPMAIVQIFDFERQEMVTLMHEQKFAQRIDMTGLPRGENPHDIVAEFQRLDPEQATYLEDVELDGRKAHLYRLEAGPIKGKTWIDAATLRPLRVEVGNPALPEGADSAIVMHAFRWGVALDDAQFDMTIPEGYHVSEMDMSHGGPEDLAFVLRVYAALTEAPFPDNFGPEVMAGLGAMMQDPGLNPQENQARLVRLLGPVLGEDAMKPENLQGSMEAFGERLGKGAIYMSQIAVDARDWTWMGGGVGPGDGDKALCYWRPADAETYQVIYDDFSVREASARELPTRPQIKPGP